MIDGTSTDTAQAGAEPAERAERAAEQHVPAGPRPGEQTAGEFEEQSGEQPGELSAELSSALSGIHRAARRSVRRELGLQPLSGAQSELLRLVVERPGIGVSAAARELHLAGNSVSTLVNHLVKDGYLSRGTSPDDRRAAVLTATAAGVDRLSRWADRRAALFAEQLDLLGPEERAALAAALPALRRLASGITDLTDSGHAGVRTPPESQIYPDTQNHPGDRGQAREEQ